jgi:ABC-type spermidine/putrescine transport system permease subunit II
METKKSPGQNTFHSKQLVIVVFATALVVSVAFLVFFVAMGEGRGPIPMLVASLILMGCFAPVIGLVQWSTLRQRVQGAAIWLLATLLGLWIAGENHE